MTEMNTPPAPRPPLEAGARQPVPPFMPPAPKRSRIGTIILIFLLLGSIFMNFVLLLAVVASFEPMDTLGGRRPLKEVMVEKPAKRGVDEKIAVIRVEGVITEGPSGGMFGVGGTDYGFLKQQVERALRDDDVKAVILKVNSPGGGASASDMMLHELKRLADPQEGDKPVVVYMGSMATSGGYYVSMAGEHIIAQPTCLTGSIGAIIQSMSLQGLLEEKLQIKAYTLKSGQFKDSGSPFRDMTEADRLYLQGVLDGIFERFKNAVLEGRPKLTRDRLDALANGKVYSAETALAAGLIDEIGFFDQAVEKAKSLAKIADAKVVEYRRQVSLFDLFAVSAAESKKPTLLNLTPDTLNAWATPRMLMLWTGQ